jgi:hypothetical protein
LPFGYRHLSNGGGEILVEKREGETEIFFFTLRAFFFDGKSAGYLYVSGESREDEIKKRYSNIEKKSEKCYWCWKR